MMSSNVVPIVSSDTTALLQKYVDRGFRLIFYPSKTKAPTTLDWQTKSASVADYVVGQNVGVVLGNELQPGRFLSDVDFDWVPGIDMSTLLPRTGFFFGHPPSKPLSHAFYTTPEPVVTQQFKNIKYDSDDGTERIATSECCFVELRGLRENGEPGFQTMVPPSLWAPKGDLSHTGERLEFYHKSSIDGDLALVTNLNRRVLLYALACLLHANIPYGGFKHEMRLACAGFLLTSALSKEETSAVMRVVIEKNGPHDRGDEIAAIESTVRALNGKRPIAGRAKFVELLGRYGPRIVSQVMKWLDKSDFITDAKKKIIPNNQENVKTAIDQLGICFSYDDFAQKPMVSYGDYNGPLMDAHVDQIWLDIDDKFHFRSDFTFFQRVVSSLGHKNSYHPVIDYLESLTWDRIPRVDEWLIQSGQAVDTDYVRAVSSIMLIAAVRRVRNPGCKYDEMVVLESAVQGLLKSTALRTLCPNDKWFSDDLPLNVDAKQIVERTLGKWIIEASDLAGRRRSDHEHLKGMLSRQTDGPVRLAYGRIPVEQPRSWILVGTTNSYTYLTDSTGNRRFWPIRIKGFDVRWIKENRDQLWAEAAVREAAGESIRLNPKLYAHASLQQERRRAEDPWETKLDESFSREEKQRLTPDEVWGVLCIPIERRDERSNERVLRAMERLGFRRMTVKKSKEDKRIKGFARDVEGDQLSAGLNWED